MLILLFHVLKVLFWRGRNRLCAVATGAQYFALEQEHWGSEVNKTWNWKATLHGHLEAVATVNINIRGPARQASRAIINKGTGFVRS
jgi:hypothetical protein